MPQEGELEIFGIGRARGELIPHSIVVRNTITEQRQYFFNARFTVDIYENKFKKNIKCSNIIICLSYTLPVILPIYIYQLVNPANLPVININCGTNVVSFMQYMHLQIDLIKLEIKSNWEVVLIDLDVN